MSIKIIDYTLDLVRGDVLRCKAEWPYESTVDFMVVDWPSDGERCYALMVVSGYKAGSFLAVLPRDSIPTTNNGFALSKEWLKDNWASRVYPECPWEDIVVFKNH